MSNAITPEEYAEKRALRYERLMAAAERAEREGNNLSNEAHRISEFIPMGQPILVGHHSEGKHRRDLARIDSKHRRGYELTQKAAALRQRAETMQKNNAIFSDDPQAAEKIEAKIERLEARQAMMKATNKLVRAGNREALADMGFSQSTIEKLLDPKQFGGAGFASFELTNNNANIRRLKARLTVEAQKDALGPEEITINNIRIVADPEVNRVQMYFGGKPSEETRKLLKSRGFRWTPSLGCWQRHYSNGAKHAAKEIARLTP